MAETGLVVIDMQAGILYNGIQRIYQKERLLKTVNARISEYRETGKPIIFIQHHDAELLRHSAEWQLSSELDFRTGDYLVEKDHPNSFYHTKLQSLLEQLKISDIEFCGAQTEFCLDTTIKFAHGLDYTCSISEHAYSTYDNDFLTAAQLNAFYHQIWQNRFLVFR